MKNLVDSVKNMSVKTKTMGYNRSFLDQSLKEPLCQSIINRMNDVNLKDLGITGTNSDTDSYHFKEKLNKITIEGNEDYRLVLFFIKKGTTMPLHDHPNMSVYFKLLFGKLNMSSYDKVTDKFKYNEFSNDEYYELIETKRRVTANKTKNIILDQ